MKITNPAEIIAKFQGKKILIVGDAIIDHYIYGSVSRVSPDAPVPLIDVIKEDQFPGAMVNILEHLKKLKAEVDVISFIGNDFEGKYFINIIEKLGVKTNRIFKVASFTPKITRIIAQNQQVCRIERNYNLDRFQLQHMNQKIIEEIEKQISDYDAIAILDYDLGFLNPILINQILALSKTHKKRVIVRPEARKYYLYKDVFILQMNRNIACAATGIEPLNETCMHIIGNRIISETNSQALFIPWVEEDSYYFVNNKTTSIPSILKYPAQTFRGIGAAMITFLTLMSAIGEPIENCITLAHFIGSLFTNKKWNNNDWNIEQMISMIENGQITSC